MATKYIDVDVKPKFESVTITNTSTVTNKVRVAWDTAVTREELVVTLEQITEALKSDIKLAIG